MPPVFDVRTFEATLKRLGLTSRELASKLDTTEPNLSRVRTGRQQPRKPLREAIERALGLEVGALEIDPTEVTTERLRLGPLERSVVESMQSLTQHQREVILAYVQGMAARGAPHPAPDPRA